MEPNASLNLKLGALGRACVRSAASWWGIIHFGAIALVMALSASTYDRANRATIARHIYTSTWQVLFWFTVLCSLVSLVLIRIVVVTALSYGLSQYALEMVVRVLVLELIPLSAALFVVLRSGLASSAELAARRRGGELVAWQENGLDAMRREFVPRMMATAFSVLTLAGVSSVVALVLAYTAVYGVSPWGLGEYTRVVGHVFSPAVALVFVLKTLLFSLAVAVIPIASAIQASGEPAGGSMPVPQGTVRLFLVLVLVEGGSLAIKYI